MYFPIYVKKGHFGAKHRNSGLMDLNLIDEFSEEPTLLCSRAEIREVPSASEGRRLQEYFSSEKQARLREASFVAVAKVQATV